jgi:hypothetical protein
VREALGQREDRHGALDHRLRRESTYEPPRRRCRYAFSFPDHHVSDWLAEERYPVVEAAAEEVAVAETCSADDERNATRKRPPDAEVAEQATSQSQPSEVATKKPRTAASTEDDPAVRAATALHSAEQFLAESLSVDALPSFSESGAALAAQTRAGEEDWRTLFAGKLFFVGGYPPQVRAPSPPPPAVRHR